MKYTGVLTKLQARFERLILCNDKYPHNHQIIKGGRTVSSLITNHLFIVNMLRYVKYQMAIVILTLLMDLSLREISGS